MSRLDDALAQHERNLRSELTVALKKKTELEAELTKQALAISQTELDLLEVTAELDRRGIETNRARGTLIHEEPDPRDTDTGYWHTQHDA
jgi:hypothetical protein